MVLDFSQNGLYMLFEITDDKKVSLKHFSNRMYNGHEKNLKWCGICDIHITGDNPDDHHGAKHTGASASALEYVSHKYYKNEYGNKLEFKLSDGKLNVIKHYQFYSEISAVRSWTTVKNISDENVGLEYVSSFSYTGFDEGTENPTDNINIYIPHNAWVREVDWQKYTLSDLGLYKNTPFSTKRISVSNTGTWSTKEHLPLAVIENKDNAFMWQIENNGSWGIEISDISDMLYFKLSGPSEQENQWYKELSPNEEFISVTACITLSSDFNGVLDEMTKYRRQIFKNNEANKTLPVIFNDYMHCLWADPTTEKMIPVIDKAAEAGAEYYCMDAGWYADGTWWETVGEWQPQKSRFPNGIKEVFDYIKSKGMIPGIWLEIEVMGINCPILDKFDDNCFFMRHGKRIIDHGRYQLDFRNEKVRAFATTVIERVVCDYGVGYIKFDYNIDGGPGTEINSDSFGDGLLEHNRAYLKWIDEIREKYPDLILENCSSGGMRMDYAMLSHHHIQSVTDQEDYRNTAYISASAPTAVIPEQSAIWAYPKKDSDTNAVVFNMVNALLQRIHLGGDICNIDEENFAYIKEAIALYKTIRGDIKNAVPYYPLDIPKYGDKFLCLAFKNQTCDRLALWRLNSKDDTINIPVTCKSAKILYPSKTDCKIYNDNESVTVVLPHKYTAVLLEIN